MCLEAGGIAWRTRREQRLEEANIAKAGWEDRIKGQRGRRGREVQFTQGGGQSREVMWWFEYK